MSDNLDQTALDALLHATPEQLEAALQLQQAQPEPTAETPETPAQPERVINRVTATAPAELSLRVKLENSLREMEAHMMMIADGQAKHGMKQAIADMRIELAG